MSRNKLPAERRHDDTQRDNEKHRHDGRENPLEQRGHPQTGQEPQHHRRKRRHDFDHRLDLGSIVRMHEHGSIDRRKHGQRNRQQQGVESAFEGPEDERRQTEFRFEVIGGAR